MAKGIPTLHVVADNIPQAHYRATKDVFENGMSIRTEYDRKEDGEFIDPSSRDARVLVEVRNPFNRPRFSTVGCSEIGTYIAEIMGVKDHLVIPYEALKEQLNSGGKLEAKEWPYAYHQRLFSFPLQDGSFLDQMETLVNRVAKSHITRRAVATTRLPEIDDLMDDDIPCLSEVNLRCTEDNGDLYLNMNTTWRSRDLYKAWTDSVVALTFMQQVLAKRLGEKMGREVKVGSYADDSYSLHIYGQDMTQYDVKDGYLKRGEDVALKSAMESEGAVADLVPYHLEELLTEPKIKEWGFGGKQIGILRDLISDLESGRLVA